MSTKFAHVAIVVRPNSAHLIVHLKQVIQLIEDNGAQVYLDQQFEKSQQLQAYQTAPLCDVLPIVDLMIVIGGDGTMLTAARMVAQYNIPLIGVNHGRLGFITDIVASEMLDILRDMLNGNYNAERRSMLLVTINRQTQVTHHQAYALNDIVISRNAMSSMLEFVIYINNEQVYAQKSDGLIFSTPTGSTAYSLAAGGPIVHPHAQVLSIVPICPQSLSNHPIVVSDNVTITIEIIAGHHAIISSDGHEFRELQQSDTIHIQKAEQSIQLLHPRNYSYYTTLRNKLHWAKQLS